uniref:Dipeptidyl peptidase 9-like n=1 Tax=Rhizophora mucronata TaxID=61149 RepID=A0A2P2L8U7_RHIMU
MLLSNDLDLFNFLFSLSSTDCITDAPTAGLIGITTTFVPMFFCHHPMKCRASKDN